MALVMPQMLWHISAAVARQQNIAPLIFGLTALLILLNVYLFQQRLVLLRTRRQLIVQLQAAEQRARTDAVTGVFNRRFMEEALARETARAERSRSKLSVMLADVDGFKNFNTKFGHLTGDRVLADVAGLLQKNFRAADLVTRYGGDEFLAMLPDCSVGQIRHVLDRLNGLHVKTNSSTIAIRYSVGWTDYTSGESLDDFLKRADAMLYANKRNSYVLERSTFETIDKS